MLKKIYIGNVPEPTGDFVSLSTREAAASMAEKRVVPGARVVITTGVWEMEAYVVNRKAGGRMTTQARVQAGTMRLSKDAPNERKERRKLRRRAKRQHGGS